MGEGAGGDGWRKTLSSHARALLWCATGAMSGFDQDRLEVQLANSMAEIEENAYLAPSSRSSASRHGGGSGNAYLAPSDAAGGSAPYVEVLNGGFKARSSKRTPPGTQADVDSFVPTLMSGAGMSPDYDEEAGLVLPLLKDIAFQGKCPGCVHGQVHRLLTRLHTRPHAKPAISCCIADQRSTTQLLTDQRVEEQLKGAPQVKRTSSSTRIT